MKKTVNIAIIDYKMSNIFSIKNALDLLGFNSQITSDDQKIISSDGAILPGVGSFPQAMNHLNDLNLIGVIKDFILSGKPFMGICLGLQLLFTKSEEFKLCDGLGIIDGSVDGFSKYPEVERVPHVGWNTIKKYNSKRQHLIGHSSKIELDDNAYFYFVHSYFVNPENKDDIFTTTNYNGIEFCSSVVKDNVFASQFHPEKSGPRGLEILRNFFN